MRQFGVSTHLFHNDRLRRDHLLEVSAHGFESVELFATRTHVDYHSPISVADLQQWLAEAGLRLHSVHAPVGESFAGGRWGPLYSLASGDAEGRALAVSETAQALYIARRVPFAFLVLHVGVPRSTPGAPALNSRDAARRSIAELHALADPLGVRLAVEIIPNELSRAGSLVHFIEDVLDDTEVGICLDVGHAHLDGDLVDAIETVSEHLLTTHVHDNRGRLDDHLLPFEGTIDWPSALTALQKVGYEGVYMLEVAPARSTRDTLKKARTARGRIETLLHD